MTQGFSLVKPLYGIFGRALTPGLRLWLTRRARIGKEDPFRMEERFGHASLPRPVGPLVWLHAASVGETQSVLTLVRGLLAQHPQLHLLITTGTVTSAALVAQQHLPRILHQFVPVDTPAAVKRFLRHWRPDLALWVESEFWPQMLWQTQARGVPMLLINARISQKTYQGWKRWPRTIASLLRGFHAVYAGSSEDAMRLQDLGAAPVYDIGNLKFDALPLPTNAKLIEELTRQIDGRPVFVAASTHANEEQLVAEAQAIVAQQFPALLTLIVPRHAVRGDAIAADLRSRGFALAQRSKGEAITPQTAIYLADTMGELGNFYTLADVVFMGGSLVAHGGQNPLEAARFNNALITGNHTHNFAAIIAKFVAAGAMQVVTDKQALASALVMLLQQPRQRTSMAQQAAVVVQQSQGASAVILQQCSALLSGRGA